MTKILAQRTETRELVTGMTVRERVIGVATVFIVNYMGDDGLAHVTEFDHDPTAAELDALAPDHTAARNAVRQAAALWDASQASWAAAGTVAAQIAAMHQEHVAMMAALRAVAMLSALT